MIVKLLDKIKELISGGLFHILGSSVISNVLALVSSVLVIRYLPKTNYGYYTIANNLYSYLAIFIGMGMASAVLQFCSEQISERQKKGIYLYALKRGTACNFLIMVAVLLVAGWKTWTGDAETGLYLALMCGLPFISYLYNFFTIVFRIQIQNQIYSRVNVLFSVFIVIGNIIFTRLWNIPGLIVSNYMAFALTSVYSVFILYRQGFFSGKNNLEPPEKDKKREINRYAILCAITNFTSTMLVLLDVTCLDLVLSDPTVLADYKVATTIPSACVIVPSALITYFYPQIVQTYSGMRKEFNAYLKRIFYCFAGVNLLICTALFFLAPVIVYLIYGEKYMNIIPLFRILTLNFFIYGSVKLLFGNVIAAMKKSEVNLGIAVISGVLNIALNLCLIPRLGSHGAAIATVCVSLIAGSFSCGYVIYNRKENIIKKRLS